MTIYDVTDEKFKKYGRIVQNIDFSQLVEVINEKTPLPDGVAYEPSVAVLEELPVYQELSTKTYGELEIEIGYCNGHNELLNAVEYHRSSEINVAATDAILILGSQQDITDDFTYDTARANGVQALYDNIAIDNGAVKLFLSCGFTEIGRTAEAIWVKKDLTTGKNVV